MKNIKYATLIICTFLLMANISFAQGALDKREYFVEILEKGRMGDPQKMTDIITFKSGKVSAKFSTTNEFPAAKYATTSKDGLGTKIITFTGETKNKKDVLEWEGVVNGDQIEGTAVRKRKGTIRTIYEFTGTLK